MKKKSAKKSSKHGHKESVHCIVKRWTGKCEPYDERKVYGSVYAACYVVRMKHADCERVAGKVAEKITKLVHNKKQVTATHIKKHATKELKRHNKHAAFMYDTHEDIS